MWGCMPLFQGLVLELERLYQRASVQAVVHKQCAHDAVCRADLLAAQLESRTVEWETACVALQDQRRLAARRTDQVGVVCWGRGRRCSSTQSWTLVWSIASQ
jgi:hypothetical protein